MILYIICKILQLIDNLGWIAESGGPRAQKHLTQGTAVA